MNSKDIGGMLKGSFPSVSTTLSDMLTQIDEASSASASSSELFAPMAMFKFPTLYRNRQGIRVDILGAVDETTNEYAQGFRFFDYFGYFYQQDGSVGSGESPDDLVSIIEAQNGEHKKKSTERWKWVHPKHYGLEIFFVPLNENNVGTVTKGLFLNRMGFVVNVSKTQPHPSDASVTIMVDDDGRQYSLSGHTRTEGDSMTDLVYVVTNTDAFIQSNWSTERPTSIQNDGQDDSPEMFDPGHSDRSHLIKEFYGALLKAHSLSKQLGIAYSFSLNTESPE